MKKTKNPGSTAIKVANEKAILKTLLHNEKNVQTLIIETGLSHQTISVHLIELEKKGLVLQMPGKDRREKIYYLSPKGFLKLNELDVGVKVEFFLFQLEMSLAGKLLAAIARDRRLPENELNNMASVMQNKFLPAIKDKGAKALPEFGNLMREIHNRNNIFPPYQPHEDNLNQLKSFAGELIFYFAAKAAQEKGQKGLRLLELLQYLPLWYYEIMKTSLIDIDYVLSNIDITMDIENALSASEKLTLKDYKKFSEAIEKFKKHQPNSSNK